MRVAYLVRRDRVWSRDKDGGHTNLIRQTRKPHAARNFRGSIFYGSFT